MQAWNSRGFVRKGIGVQKKNKGQLNNDLYSHVWHGHLLKIAVNNVNIHLWLAMSSQNVS